ncbi:MAG TPA: leucyl aminopeptidase [Gammaproteobacteria bacterium]|nr:leucyl aminopeptidase [Gammaproteobacteria bacterium]
MEFSIKIGPAEKQRSACLVVGVFEARLLTPSAKALDKVSGGFLTQVLKRGDLEGKIGQTLVLHHVPGTLCERILLVGCGKERELDEAHYRKLLGKAASALKATGAAETIVYLAELDIKARDFRWKIRQAVEVADHALYEFDRLKSKKENTPTHLKKIIWGLTQANVHAQAEQGLREGLTIAASVKLARDLGNLPANICTPSYLAEQAKSLGKRHKKLKVTVLEKADMERLGMGALLAVARGSREPAKLITLEYHGAGKAHRPVALVGKGVTFDTGGISIKPADKMDEMKYDMSGAGSVLAALSACAELQLPINVVGIIPATENMPSGNAIKPGDIVTSLSGQTIEILNTDAEGRLILCDALTYSERYKPEVVIDIATLTGACVIALGRHASGLLSNHRPLADALQKASDDSGDRVWELPLWDDYQDQLKSNFADMSNVGGREAGTITAACFLWRFTKKFHWAHLDIAGTAWTGGDRKGSTGRPVPLLMQYLLNRIPKKAKAAA